MVVGIHEELQVHPELFMGVVVVALDRRVPRLREGKLLMVRFIRST